MEIESGVHEGLLKISGVPPDISPQTTGAYSKISFRSESRFKISPGN
jgi:hypothetical protein